MYDKDDMGEARCREAFIRWNELYLTTESGHISVIELWEGGTRRTTARASDAGTISRVFIRMGADMVSCTLFCFEIAKRSRYGNPS